MVENKNGLLVKLLEVKKKVRYLRKDEQGGGGQYDYASPEKVLGAINPELNERGIILMPQVVDESHDRVVVRTRNGDKNETMFILKMNMVWIDTTSGEKIECPWYGVGCNGDEKGFGSALTYAERYFMLKFFNIPTGTDDPDAKECEDYGTGVVTGPYSQSPKVFTPSKGKAKQNNSFSL